MALPPITAPRRGANRAPKASRPALWASSAGGLQPPDPLGLRPPAPAERRRGHPRTSSAVSRAGPVPVFKGKLEKRRQAQRQAKRVRPEGRPPVGKAAPQRGHVGNPQGCPACPCGGLSCPAGSTGRAADRPSGVQCAPLRGALVSPEAMAPLSGAKCF